MSPATARHDMKDDTGQRRKIGKCVFPRAADTTLSAGLRYA
jgi:hypothetical protein